MLERFTNVVYWGCCIVSFLLIIAIIVGTFSDIQPPPYEGFFEETFLYASLIWVTGWIIRYILSGKKSIKP